MKWNNIFFKVDFNNSIQNGINEFARLSGYKIKETDQAEKAKPIRRNSMLYVLLMCLLMLALLSTLSLNT
jgi:hypothetical protein